MQNLLKYEMKRALYLLEETNVSLTNWDKYKEVAELKQLLLMIRKHSIIFEKGGMK